MQVLNSARVFLNQPVVKEGAKELFSGLTFIFGVIEVYDAGTACLKSLQGRVSLKKSQQPDDWKTTSYKVVLLIAKISLVTSALGSRIGVKFIGYCVSKISTAEQLMRFFGPNSNFATNPYHPRHILNIANFIMGIPTTLKVMYGAFTALKEKCSSKQHENPLAEEPELADRAPPRYVPLDHKTSAIDLYSTYPEAKKGDDDDENDSFVLLKKKNITSTDMLSPKTIKKNKYVERAVCFNTLTNRTTLHGLNYIARVLTR